MTTPGSAQPRLVPAQIDEPATPLLRMIGNNPRLVPLFRQLTKVLVTESELPPRVRWLITMRTALRCDCSYEFGRRAKDAMQESDIKLVPLPLESKDLSLADRQVFALADQIHQTQRIDDALWAELAAAYTPAQIVRNDFGRRPLHHGRSACQQRGCDRARNSALNRRSQLLNLISKIWPSIRT